MALIKCPECGKEVSDRAKACPSCAYPIPQTIFQAPSPSFTPSQKPKTGPLGVRSETCMRFRNPLDGRVIEIFNPFLWTLVFGPFYWAKHEAWLPVIIGFLVVIFSAGFCWLLLPIFAQMAIRYGYRARGWEEA